MKTGRRITLEEAYEHAGEIYKRAEERRLSQRERDSKELNQSFFGEIDTPSSDTCHCGGKYRATEDEDIFKCNRCGNTYRF